jgi:hypothetical protein
MDAKIIDMDAYDLVLGMNWLEQFSPMTCNWLDKWIEFQYKQKTIKLQGWCPPHHHSSCRKFQLNKFSSGKREMTCWLLSC